MTQWPKLVCIRKSIHLLHLGTPKETSRATTASTQGGERGITPGTKLFLKCKDCGVKGHGSKGYGGCAKHENNAKPEGTTRTKPTINATEGTTKLLNFVSGNKEMFPHYKPEGPGGKLKCWSCGKADSSLSKCEFEKCKKAWAAFLDSTKTKPRVNSTTVLSETTPDTPKVTKVTIDPKPKSILKPKT